MTLIPYIPGFAGDYERVNRVLKEKFNIENPENVKGEQVLSFSEENLEKTRVFLEKLSNNIEYVDEKTRSRIILKLLGFIYMAEIEHYLIDLNEAMGILDLFLSIDLKNPYYIILSSRDDLLLFQIMAYSRESIDELILEISSLINNTLINRTFRFENSVLKRPEIIIDILRDLGIMPSDKPIVLASNTGLYTSISEALRIEKDVSKVYSACNELQLCEVDENGNLVKA
jgi:hypothetical protein